MKLIVKKIITKNKKRKVRLNKDVEKEHPEKTDLIEDELNSKELPMRFLN